MFRKNTLPNHLRHKNLSVSQNQRKNHTDLIPSPPTTKSATTTSPSSNKSLIPSKRLSRVFVCWTGRPGWHFFIPSPRTHNTGITHKLEACDEVHPTFIHPIGDPIIRSLIILENQHRLIWFSSTPLRLKITLYILCKMPFKTRHITTAYSFFPSIHQLSP